MHNGGKPSLSVYSMSAPNSRRALTSTWMGRCFIRSVPVMMRLPGVTERYAVRNRMAVPAAMMSMVSPALACKARIMTCVSSQSDKFSGWSSPFPKALMMSARLLMLFEAGNWMVARMLSGGVILIFIFFFL